jgi:hypothetical protein
MNSWLRRASGAGANVVGWLLIASGCFLLLLFVGVVVTALWTRDEVVATVLGGTVLVGVPAVVLLLLGRRLRRWRAGEMSEWETEAATLQAPVVGAPTAATLSPGSTQLGISPVGSNLLVLDTFVCTATAPSLMANTATVSIQDTSGLVLAQAALAFGVTSEQAQRQARDGIELVSPEGGLVVRMKARKAVVWNTLTWDILGSQGETIGACSHKSIQLTPRDRWPFHDRDGRPIAEISESLELATVLRLVPLLGQLVTRSQYLMRCRGQVVAKIENAGIGLHVDVLPGNAVLDRRLLLAFCVLRFATRS